MANQVPWINNLLDFQRTEPRIIIPGLYQYGLLKLDLARSDPFDLFEIFLPGSLLSQRRTGADTSIGGRVTKLFQKSGVICPTETPMSQYPIILSEGHRSAILVGYDRLPRCKCCGQPSSQRI